MLSILKTKDSNLAMVRDRMMYLKGEKERGIILGKVIEELGDWLQYIFLPRNPAYFCEESVFINFLIDESEFNSDGTLEDGCLTKRLIDWIDKNIPHETFEEIKDIDVWGVEFMPTIPKGKFMEGKKYNLVISIDGEKPYLWVWKK